LVLALPGLLVVEHDRDAPAGLLTGWADTRGLPLRTVRLHAGHELPQGLPPADCRGVVLLGSEQTAFDDQVPWLAGELSFVSRLLAADVPVLGICFGGQVLARVLGARVFRLPAPEIGWVWAPSRCPGLASGPWPSWHQDAFELPGGAALLAANEVAVQAFGSGPHVGVQFHPEASRPIVASWLAGSSTPPPAEQTDPLLGDAAGPLWEQAAANAEKFFSGWLDGGLACG
jgi:GMP synthase-like glutamine amidotransferase